MAVSAPVTQYRTETIKGFEVELLAAPTDNLTILAGIFNGIGVETTLVYR